MAGLGWCNEATEAFESRTRSAQDPRSVAAGVPGWKYTLSKEDYFIEKVGEQIARSAGGRPTRKRKRKHKKTQKWRVKKGKKTKKKGGKDGQRKKNEVCSSICVITNLTNQPAILFFHRCTLFHFYREKHDDFVRVCMTH